MIVNPSRIGKLLEPHGFVLGRTSRIEKSYSFFRSDQEPELFQWIKVEGAGRRGEAVAAEVAVSVTKRVSLTGLMELHLIKEIASVKERGWTIISTAKEARAWENRLASIGPLRATEFARERGPELLSTTDSARRAAKHYLEHLDLERSLDEQLHQLRQRCDQALIERAERLAAWPGVMQEYHAEDVYLLCTSCILCYENEVETASTSFSREDPLENAPLMWRIQLVADVLLCHYRSLPCTETK